MKTRKPENKKTKKPVSKKQREQIKAAAEAIPGLVMGELPEVKRMVDYTSHGYRQRRKLLWLGVGTLTIGIFAVWMFGMHTVLTEVFSRGSVEGTLYRQARSDLSGIIESFSVIEEQIETESTAAAEEEDEDTRQLIKEQLAAVLSAVSTTTSTSPSGAVTSTE